jgi:hypothetical protein
MFATTMDRTDHCCNGHAALTRDFLKTVPELVFEADTRFVSRNDELSASKPETWLPAQG